MAVNKKEIREFRGVKNLVIAEILEDSAEKFETGTPEYLAGAAKVSKTTESNRETHYYDNVAALAISTEGGDTYTLEISALDLKTLALITGREYDATNDCIVGSEPTPKFFALGYETQDTSGKARYKWAYKGLFSFPDEEYSTKTDSAEASGQTLEYINIYTIYNFTYKMGEKEVTKVVKDLVLSDEGSFDTTTFFDTVVTPDVVFPVA